MTLGKHLRSVLALVVVVVVVVSLAVLIASSLLAVIRVQPDPTFTDPVDRRLLVMSPAGRDLQLENAAERAGCQRDASSCRSLGSIQMVRHSTVAPRIARVGLTLVPRLPRDSTGDDRL
jgi:hypothetical protein